MATRGRVRAAAFCALAALACPLRALSDPPMFVFPDDSPAPPPAPSPAPSPSTPTPSAPVVPAETSAELLPEISIRSPTASTSSGESTPGAPSREAVRRVLLGANVGAMFGQTTFGLALMSGGFVGRSELDYSLDTITAGIDAAYLGGGHGARPWSLHVSFDTNLSDPFGPVLDRDWVGSGGTSFEFSHTDSELTSRIVLADLSARVALAGWRRPGGVVLDFILGYRHESMVFDAWGLTGWQLGSGFTMAPVSLDPSIRVVHYESQKLLPHVGLGLHAPLGRRMLLDADASVALAVSIDRDDHVIRHKLGEATSAGIGFLLHVAPQWIVSGSGTARSSVALGLDLQLRYLYAIGTLHQHFYADDPTQPGDQSMTVIPDSAFTATSLAGSVRATVAVRF